MTYCIGGPHDGKDVDNGFRPFLSVLEPIGEAVTLRDLFLGVPAQQYLRREYRLLRWRTPTRGGGRDTCFYVYEDVSDEEAADIIKGKGLA